MKEIATPSFLLLTFFDPEGLKRNAFVDERDCYSRDDQSKGCNHPHPLMSPLSVQAEKDLNVD